MAQIYPEFGPRRTMSPDFMACFEGIRSDSGPTIVNINDWDRPPAMNEKPFPIPSWRTENNTKKFSEETKKWTASPEAIERLKAELALRGVLACQI